MEHDLLKNRTVVVTGGARRLGRLFALACARRGADLVVHHGHSAQEASLLSEEIRRMGRSAHVVEADLGTSAGIDRLIGELDHLPMLYALLNSAAIFENIGLEDTSLEAWQRHLSINLTAPFLLSQAFAARLKQKNGVIVNILDWRALRPRADHFPYTVTKAALAGMTRSLAVALAPRIRVNGLALGSIMPPGSAAPTAAHIAGVPMGRWPEMGEVEDALIFLLAGSTYTTGEILHVDGGRHLI